MQPQSLRPVAAVGVACFRDDAVLLIRRGTPPRLGEWSLPGGRIEWGETVRAAAARELLEETGVEAEILGLVDVVDGLFDPDQGPERGRHFVLIDFVAVWRQGAPRAGDDAAAAAFVPLVELEALGLWSETLRVIRAAHRQLQGRSHE